MNETRSLESSSQTALGKAFGILMAAVARLEEPNASEPRDITAIKQLIAVIQKILGGKKIEDIEDIHRFVNSISWSNWSALNNAVAALNAGDVDTSAINSKERYGVISAMIEANQVLLTEKAPLACLPDVIQTGLLGIGNISMVLAKQHAKTLITQSLMGCVRVAEQSTYSISQLEALRTAIASLNDIVVQRLLADLDSESLKSRLDTVTELNSEFERVSKALSDERLYTWSNAYLNTRSNAYLIKASTKNCVRVHCDDLVQLCTSAIIRNDTRHQPYAIALQVIRDYRSNLLDLIPDADDTEAVEQSMLNLQTALSTICNQYHPDALVTQQTNIDEQLCHAAMMHIYNEVTANIQTNIDCLRQQAHTPLHVDILALQRSYHAASHPADCPGNTDGLPVENADFASTETQLTTVARNVRLLEIAKEHILMRCTSPAFYGRLKRHFSQLEGKALG